MQTERLEHIKKLISEYEELGRILIQEVSSYKEDFGETIPINENDFFSTLATALCGDTPEDFEKLKSCFVLE